MRFMNSKPRPAPLPTTSSASIRIAAQPVYVDTYLLDVIAKFKHAYPGVAISVTDTGLSSMPDMISSRQCDLGIGITLNLRDPRILVTPLAHSRAVCLMPRDHRLAAFETVDIDLLRDENFVELAIGAPLRTKIDYIFQVAGWPRRIAVEAPTIRTVARLVERNVGIAVIDLFADPLIDKSKAVMRPLTPVIDWDVALFTASHERSAVEKSFLTFLRAELSHLPQGGHVI